jgi:DNA-binding HxlR family transcriptional regulator
VVEPSYEVFKDEMKKGVQRLQNLKKKENQAFKRMMTRRVKMLENKDVFE